MNSTVLTPLSTTSPLQPMKILQKRLLTFESEDKVAIVNGEKEIVLGKITPSPLQCFFINDSPKIDDTAVYEIMSQLTDDVDISDLAHITI